MTPVTSHTSVNAQKTLYLYNPGTERADVVIRMQGNVGGGVTIHNATNGTECRVVGLTKELSTNIGETLNVSAVSGKTYMTDENGNARLAFVYHNKGYLTLEPYGGSKDEMQVSWGSNTDQVRPVGTETFPLDAEGKFIYIANTWRKITNRADDVITVTPGMSSAGSTTSPIVQMNEIIVTPDDSMA